MKREIKRERETRGKEKERNTVADGGGEEDGARKRLSSRRVRDEKREMEKSKGAKRVKRESEPLDRLRVMV